MAIQLHIISFDVPSPPTYGGVIDVFYKLRALHAEGVAITLHCFLYQRSPDPELEKFCKRIFYYTRQSGLLVHLSRRPYIVQSRMPEKLLKNLLADDDPILFEGLHSCGFMSDRRLQGRTLIYRESNIEHHYYYHLFKAEKSLWRKFFFLAETIRLKPFQKVLQVATLMLTVSLDDTRYLQEKFPSHKVVYLPSFHPEDVVQSKPGKGTYALYQGKLSVPENYQAVDYLIEKVWIPSMPELVIAGSNPPRWLVQKIHKKSNIRLRVNPDEKEMSTLVHDAQVNILVTFQPTGLKLKLLSALFNGRFCLVNPAMTAGTSLEPLCITASTPDEFREKTEKLFSLEFTPEEMKRRASLLEERYSNRKNCKLLVEMLTLSSVLPQNTTQNPNL